MGQPGGLTKIRCDADTAASESLARLADARRADNIADAVVVHELHRLSEIRLSAEMDIHLLGSSRAEEQPDMARARHTTECESAVALSLSRRVTRGMITVANQLAWRLPAVDAAFTIGDLDYPRVRTIALTLRRASDETVSALESDVLAAALRCNTSALTNNIWRQWTAFAPDEAAAARQAAVTEERCAEIRRGDDSVATLVAKMSTLEGAECDALIEEMAGTVCSRDPRTKKQLRGHALLALLHREESLACMCGSESCPVAAASALNPPRRKALLQVHIDIETLLGLNSNPATLADGTVLDADTARLLATDARWQALLTEMLDAVNDYRVQESEDTEEPEESEESEANTTDGDATGGSTDTDTGTSTGTGADDSTGVKPLPRRRDNRVGPRARRLLRRGRRRSAAPLPERTNESQQTSCRNDDTLGAEGVLSNAIADFLAAAASDPSLAEGQYPDGHGGYDQPPTGALTYRPSAEMVALTRATYCTCTFPGCSVPAGRCDIDHIVPFDHDDPLAGGWTILANLHPLCSYHHHAKTLRLWACAKLDGNGIYWRSSAGLHHITPAEFGTVTVSEEFVHSRRYRPSSPRPPTPHTPTPHTPTPDAPCGHTDAHSAVPAPTEPPDELYEPTWWEVHISDQDSDWHLLLRATTRGGAPTLGDLAELANSDDPQVRADAAYLRERFLEHRAIVAERDKFRPPPY